MTTYNERLANAIYDLGTFLEENPGDNPGRMIGELAENLVPGGTYDTLLTAAELFQMGEIGSNKKLMHTLREAIYEASYRLLVRYAQNFEEEDYG